MPLFDFLYLQCFLLDSHSEFLKHWIDNRPLFAKSILRTCLFFKISKEPFEKKSKSTGLPPSVYKVLFKQIAYSSCVIIAIGIGYEIARRICKRKNIDICRPTSQVVGMIAFMYSSFRVSFCSFQSISSKRTYHYRCCHYYYYIRDSLSKLSS